jgi:hypothetical protein
VFVEKLLERLTVNDSATMTKRDRPATWAVGQAFQPAFFGRQAGKPAPRVWTVPCRRK